MVSSRTEIRVKRSRQRPYFTGTRLRTQDYAEASEGDNRDRSGLPRPGIGLAMTNGKGLGLKTLKALTQRDAEGAPLAPPPRAAEEAINVKNIFTLSSEPFLWALIIGLLCCHREPKSA